MFRIDDIYDEGKKIVGACDDIKFFRWCGDVVTMTANKGDFEGWKGYLDICSCGCSCSSSGGGCSSGKNCGRRCISLPREVDVVLAVNIGGHPSLGFDQTFNFHLNGLGDCCVPCNFSWQDQGGFHVTYRDLITPAKIVTHLQTPDDNGKQFIVQGYDKSGNRLRRNVNGTWLDGILIPTIYGYALPDSEQPEIARITGIYKDKTAGTIRLGTIDSSGTSGVTLGIYEPDEQLPQFRRIKINRCADWVRIAYKKSNPVFDSRFDHVPLKSRLGFLIGLQARKHYSDLQIAEAHAYEADAARLEIEAQNSSEPPVYAPIQVVDRTQKLNDCSDYDIV